MIDKNGHIKLTDFGLSELKIKNKIKKLRTQKSLKYRSNRKAVLMSQKNNLKLIGTPDYIAPEIINQTSINNKSIDWWSLGVIAYEMMIGCPPFSAMTVDEILCNILEGQIEWP